MAEHSERVRVTADVGGTFIDFIAADARTGELKFDKQSASSENLVAEFMAALRRMGLSGAAISQLFHGTTIAINAVVQERGAKVGLVTTAGFRDVLELGRGGRPYVYDWRFAPQPPLVPRELRFEVEERMLPTGDRLEPLNHDGLDHVVEELRAANVEAVAVCLLHAYANSRHEQAVAELLRTALPGVAVTASHEVMSEWREFERTSSTVVNAYVQPLFSRYLTELSDALAADGYREPIGIMQSNGGVLAAERAARVPLRTLMSGPAGGAVASRELAATVDVDNAICADVGGTTFDVALVIGGQLVERTETMLDGRPVLDVGVDISSVGAGGGSVAWIDDRGALEVGPRSAGAVPGPVCFGNGGTEATVTDAQLLLGYLDPEFFLGGRLTLDYDAAQKVVRSQVAEPLGLAVTDAAVGMIRIAETNMANACRKITVQRGLDPRDFALIAYGGGGGLFAAGVADELGVRHVLAPREAANFSAWGILCSDYTEDAGLTKIMPATDANASVIVETLTGLAGEVTANLTNYGFAPDDVEVHYAADARFAGQHHTVTVALDDSWVNDTATLSAGLEREFRALHERMYGPRTHDSSLEVVTLRARGTVAVATPGLPALERADDGTARGTRSVRFSQPAETTALWDRASLGLGQRLGGPAIVEEWANTTLVPSGWEASVDQVGHLHLSPSNSKGTNR